MVKRIISKKIVTVHGFSVLPVTKTADKGSKVQ